MKQGMEEPLVTRIAGPAALIATLTALSPAAGAACQDDVSDLERVLPVLTMPSEVRRESEALQSQAASLCDKGDQAGADQLVQEAWGGILASDEVAARTVAELATETCSGAVSMVRTQADGSTAVGAMGRDMAEKLIDDAVELCGQDERMLAEEKLALAIAILSGE